MVSVLRSLLLTLRTLARSGDVHRPVRYGLQRPRRWLVALDLENDGPADRSPAVTIGLVGSTTRTPLTANV
jgi:hypothetical protein